MIFEFIRKNLPSQNLVPIDRFIFSNPAETCSCCHFASLRPRTALANSIQGGREMLFNKTLPRLFSGPFSNRGFEQTVASFSLKECSRINRDAGRFCRLGLVGTAPFDPYRPSEFGGHRIGYVSI
jgi:hypothetical protein